MRNTTVAMMMKSRTVPLKWPIVQLNRQNPTLIARQSPDGVQDADDRHDEISTIA
jgi:hypothetical protein